MSERRNADSNGVLTSLVVERREGDFEAWKAVSGRTVRERRSKTYLQIPRLLHRNV